MQMDVAMAVVPAVVLGFLAGLFGFRIKSRWCPVCGETLVCPTHASVPSGRTRRGPA